MLTIKNERFGFKSLLKRNVVSIAITLSLTLSATVPVVALDASDVPGLVTDNIVVSTVIPVEKEDEYNEMVSEEIEAQALLEQQVIKQIEAEEKAAYINSIVCDPNNVSRISGLKEEDYKILTKGTWWEGNEQALIDLEKNYGVNAMFAMSVSTLESAYGKSSRAKNRNNYYGLELKKVWNGLYSNTQHWGNVIARYYVNEGRLSASAISTKYCPPNSSYWASFVNSNMKKLYNELIIKLNSTEN